MDGSSHIDARRIVWTPELVSALTEAWGNNISIFRIGLELGVSRNAIAMKAKKLGLRRPRETYQYRAPKSPGHPAWTSEQSETLTRLWDTGAPASWIAKEMGLSREAVLGKARRLDLPRRRHYKPQRTSQEQRDRCVLSLEAWPKTGECLFPYGASTADPNFHFCAAPVATKGAPYCFEHMKSCFVPQHKNHANPKLTALVKRARVPAVLVLTEEPA